MSKQEVGHQLSPEELHLRQLNRKHHKDGPIIIAVGVNDQYNIGGILRSAEAIGSKRVFFINDNLNISEKKIKRLSRNASDLVDYESMSLENFLSIYQELPPLVALEITSGSVDIFASKFPFNMSIVIGSEKYGIPEEILELCSQAIHLPMVGINSSLNVVSALSVALYEWHSRFRTPPTAK